MSARMINIYEAKTKLSQLLREVAAGEEVVIARAGEPIARLVPYREAPPRRRFGLLAGAVKVSEDFDSPLDDALLDAFEGA